jgi:hypothetical protein
VLFSLLISTIFLIVVNAVAFFRKGTGFFRKETGVGRATLCSLAAIIPLGCSLRPVLPLIALAVAGAGAVCCAAKARPRWFLASSLIATVAVYALIALPDVLAWDRLKKDFPMESLASRLAYEERPRNPAPSETRASSKVVDHLVSLETRLNEEEYHQGVYFRTRSLERLHGGVVKQFLDSPGFGIGRVRPRAGPSSLERQMPEETIPQPNPSIQPPDLASAPLLPASGKDLLKIHDDNTVDFLDPYDFGYIRDREHVAGFRPHQFHELPRAPKRWRVNRLELVGLLQYDEPVVYLSVNLPRMDELSQAPTRSVDGFEKEALGGLRHGEDLMVQETPQQMRLLGSIRAVETCLRCHQVQRGELLGAFSYQFLVEEPSSK